MRRLLLLIIGLSLSSSLYAVQRFQTPMHDARWTVKANKVHCELVHPISYYGEARFVYTSGGELAFEMSVLQKSPKASVASLYSAAPFWREPYSGELAQLNISKGKKPVYIGGKLARRMLYELQKGYKTIFHYKDWADYQEDVYVTLSPVNFYRELSEFLGCLDNALPYGVEGLKDVVVHFAHDKALLGPEQRERLDILAMFAAVDENLQIRLLGHTDSRGRRQYNQRLSERRAISVQQYLASKGVSSSQISRRGMGEAKPVASNRTPYGRALNRRVNVIIQH